MKKILAGTTALVAAAVVAGQAQAADPVKVSVSGFIGQAVGYVDADEASGNKYAKVNIHSDSEVYFRGNTKLDNGLTVGVNIDLYTDRGDDSPTSDDVFLYVSSETIGKVKIGATKGSSYGMSNTAPNVGYVGLNDGGVADWVNNPTGVSLSDNDTMVVSASNDGNKIAWTSPNFGGIQLGASYGLDATGVNETEVNIGTSTGADTMYDLAIAYSGDFDGVSVGADVSYQRVFNGGLTGTTAADEKGIRAGLSIGVAGFTVGGSYMDQDNAGEVKNVDFKAWDAGVSYEFDQYAVSFTYMKVEQENSATDTDSSEEWAVGGSYDLGAGVSLSGTVFGVEYDDGSTTTTGTNQEAWGVVTGLTVSF